MNKLFEIHITGKKEIIEELNAMGIKNIVVELLTPSLDIYKIEYMSSFILKKKCFEECEISVNDILNKLKSNVIRVKIETPYYEEYKDISLYMESHFTPFNSSYPISRNQRTHKLMGTARTYDKKQYLNFMDKWKNTEVELCLKDSFINEDSDWFNLYS